MRRELLRAGWQQTRVVSNLATLIEPVVLFLGKPRPCSLESELLEVTQMHGTFGIFRTSDAESTFERYQVRYEDLAGNSFSGNVDPHELRELLYDKLAMGLTDEQLDKDYDRLLREGHIVFPEIEMREEELAGAGLTYLPAEG